jgi:branched-chain amino acid transport system ATP-binding protein
MLNITDLHAGYGAAEVLSGVTLHVPRGQVVALIGANGAGKTTCLHAISGLVRARSGRIQLDGHDITNAAPHNIVARGLIHCPEGRRVFARMTVAENLALGAHLRRDTAAVREDLARVYEAFAVLGERQSQLAGTLSGGEQQMLAIGRASMARPRVLLLDEPSLGLAPRMVRRVFAALGTLMAAGGEPPSILLVEQNASVALAVADSAYVMEGGRIVLQGPAAELQGDARVRASYLGG